MTSKDIEPTGYAATLAHLKTQVRAAQTQAIRAANTSLLELYWTIGAEVLSQQHQQGWGTKVIERLARDLRAEFPEMRGLNRSNLYAMRAFAQAWPDRAIVPTVLGRLSWSHVRCLLKVQFAGGFATSSGCGGDGSRWSFTPNGKARPMASRPSISAQ